LGLTRVALNLRYCKKQAISNQLCGKAQRLSTVIQLIADRHKNDRLA
jgi:hypothetical protein